MAKTELQETAELMAAREGVPLDRLFDHMRERLRNSTYPTKNCLSPGVIEDERLLPLLAHMLSCPMCAALVDVAWKNKGGADVRARKR